MGHGLGAIIEVVVELAVESKFLDEFVLAKPDVTIHAKNSSHLSSCVIVIYVHVAAAFFNIAAANGT